ncbi:MAG: YbaB/EbfC family nucleoid-associated protein [Candidatus Omnitrophota bacterium]
MFDKMKALMDMQKKMQEVKRELDNTIVEAEGPGGYVKITMTGAQEVKEVHVLKGVPENEREALERSLKDGFNRAVKRSQEAAAQKMKSVTGLNIPGLT